MVVGKLIHLRLHFVSFVCDLIQASWQILRVSNPNNSEILSEIRFSSKANNLRWHLIVTNVTAGGIDKFDGIDHFVSLIMTFPIRLPLIYKKVPIYPGVENLGALSRKVIEVYCGFRKRLRSEPSTESPCCPFDWLFGKDCWNDCWK